MSEIEKKTYLGKTELFPTILQNNDQIYGNNCELKGNNYNIIKNNNLETFSYLK